MEFLNRGQTGARNGNAVKRVWPIDLQVMDTELRPAVCPVGPKSGHRLHVCILGRMKKKEEAYHLQNVIPLSGFFMKNIFHGDERQR